MEATENMSAKMTLEESRHEKCEKKARAQKYSKNNGEKTDLLIPPPS
jgi:hypothetical protein